MTSNTWHCGVCLFMQVVGLYKKLGFVDDPEGIRGMAFQRRQPVKEFVRQKASILA